MSLKLDGAGPLNRQVYRAVLAAIGSGELRYGERLWSSRTLQQQLGVSRNVVLMALSQLTAEGHLEARRGSGTYISAPGVSASPPRRVASRRWASAVQPRFDVGGAQSLFA